MIKVILDTNVVIEVSKDNSAVIDQLVQYNEWLFTSVGLGELYYGAYNSTQLSKHLKECKVIERSMGIIPISAETTEHYGHIKPNLRKSGKLIPENDIWIAAIARQLDITLVTMDKHFERISPLKKILLEK